MNGELANMSVEDLVTENTLLKRTLTQTQNILSVESKLVDRQAEEITRLSHTAIELITVLEKIVSASNCNYELGTMEYAGLFDQARAAIAKAKGE